MEDTPFPLASHGFQALQCLCRTDESSVFLAAKSVLGTKGLLLLLTVSSREVGLLRAIKETAQRPNLYIDLLDLFVVAPQTCLVFEFCDTSLYDYYKALAVHQPSAVPLKVKELLQGLIVGDVKASNILGKQTFPGFFEWKLCDFDHAQEWDEALDPGTYLGPEWKRVLRRGRGVVLAGYTADVFALGCMVGDLLTNFSFYSELDVDSDAYLDEEIDVPIPDKIPHIFREKLPQLLAKVPSKRCTISALRNSSMFKDLSTVARQELGRENFGKSLDALQTSMQQSLAMQEKVAISLERMEGLLMDINQKLDEFLPAIQRNLLDLMATEACPGKFVLAPVKSSFLRNAAKCFYTKYDLWFFCEHEGGMHLVQDKAGFNLYEVTSLGRYTMFFAKLLLMVAIKQLTGLNLHLGCIELDLRQLNSSLTAINTEILSWDVATLQGFQVKDMQDWDNLSRAVMPGIKDFLKGKDRSKMGVQPSSTSAGRQTWLCAEHYGSVKVETVGLPPTYNASGASSSGQAAQDASVPPPEFAASAVYAPPPEPNAAGLNSLSRDVDLTRSRSSASYYAPPSVSSSASLNSLSRDADITRSRSSASVYAPPKIVNHDTLARQSTLPSSPSAYPAYSAPTDLLAPTSAS
ncbi:hypothetical protein HDU91_004823, partial [Kappamyces sp. JEL0680]